MPFAVSTASAPATGTMTDIVRVLHVTWSLQPGGLERVICQTVESTKPLGISHAVLCLHAGGELAKDLPDDVPVTVAGVDGRDIAGAGAIRRAVAACGATVVHGHNWCTWPAMTLATLGRPTRVIWTLHGWDRSGRMPIRRALACNLMARRTAAITTVSETGGLAFCSRARIALNRMHVIPNAVDVTGLGQLQRRPDDGALVVAGIGRLTEIKDWPAWLQAIAYAKTIVDRPVRGLIVGDGPLRGKLEQMAVRMGLSDSVTFMGYQPDIRPVLAGAGALMLLSRGEGLPLVPLEAMAAGVPVVVTSVGGLPEIVRHQRTGLLVPPRRPDIAAQMLGWLANSPDYGRDLAKAAKAYVCEHHAPHVVAGRYAALYRRVAETTGLLDADMPSSTQDWGV